MEQKKSRKGLVIGLALGGTALVAATVVLVLVLTGVIGGKKYSVFLSGTEYGKYKAGSNVTVQQEIPDGVTVSFSSEDVTLSRDERNGMFLLSFVMPERDVRISVEKTAVLPPGPAPDPDPVDPDKPTELSGETVRWGVTYFGLELPAEWDDDMVMDFSKNIHLAPNYMEMVLSIEDNNWITLSPCTDLEIITRLETGFELVGILDLPSGYPLYLTMELDADPSTESGAWLLEHKEELIDSIRASDGAWLEKDVIYTGGPMTDMTGLKGSWSSEGGGMRTLTILSDATFRLHSYDFQGGEGKEERGFLVFNEGVCEVWNESGMPWSGMEGDTYLERNVDGTIFWVEGTGVEQFVPAGDVTGADAVSPTVFLPLYDTVWYVDGMEGTASIAFDDGTGFTLYYASGSVEAEGEYLFVEENGTLYCRLTTTDGTIMDMKAFYSPGAGQYILEYNGMYYMEPY